MFSGVPGFGTPLSPIWGRYRIQGAGLDHVGDKLLRDKVIQFSFKTSKLEPSLLSLTGVNDCILRTHLLSVH